MVAADEPVVLADDDAPVPPLMPLLPLVPAPVWPAADPPLPAVPLPAPELCAYATPMASENTPTDKAVINFFISDLLS